MKTKYYHDNRERTYSENFVIFIVIPFTSHSAEDWCIQNSFVSFVRV